MRRSTLFILLGLLTVLPSVSQTVQWAVRPTSAQIENYGNLLKVKKAGKCGLLDLNNNEIIPVSYDSISPFRDGMALVMNKVGDQLKIEGVMSDGDYELMPVSETVYATRYMFFSEGKMPVKGEGGWGYLDTDGNVVIPCQFQIAYPFSEGFASVKIDNKTYYVNRNLEYMPIEVGWGNLVFGSTFSGQEAVVYSGYSLTPKGYVINHRGRVVRKFKTDIKDLRVNSYDHSVGNKEKQYHEQVQQAAVDSRYMVYQENGRYGYKRDGVIVLPAQMDKAEPVRGGFANVQYNGQNGVLHMIDGTFSVESENRKLEVVGQQVDRGYLKLSVPEALIDAPVRMRLVDSEGNEMKVQALSTQGESRTFAFLPVSVPKESGKMDYVLEVWNENLILWKNQGSVDYTVVKPVSVGETVKVSTPKTSSSSSTSKTTVASASPKATPKSTPSSNMHIASLSISAPKAADKWADPSRNFNVTVKVSNSGDQTGKANVSLFVDGKKVGTKSNNVKGRSNTSFTFAAVTNVKKEKYAKVRATLSDGKSSEETIIRVLPR